MRMIDIIRKKQLSRALSREEIRWFVSGYSSGEIPDYQAAALVMAVWFSGMDEEETAELTSAMAESGEMVDLSGVDGIVVDKHSSGGVADTTTIAAGPIVAACGGMVAKMSGRGLSFSGGTLDKLESIPGFRTDLSMERFIEMVNTCGVSIIGQTKQLVPADRMLYALRDVTSTVDSMPLIAASIMSKKIAGGGNKILLDVKWGSGAFMRTSESAERLASMMVEIGKHTGRDTRALVTDMNQPLGNAVGNALEVEEAIRILRGELEGDLKDLIVELCVHMLEMGEVCSSRSGALREVHQVLEDGSALEKLKEMIGLQGGDPRVCDDVTLLPQAEKRIAVESSVGGWISSMQADEIGIAAAFLGAGRMKKEDVIDPAVGCWMKKRIGDQVSAGEPLAVLYVNRETDAEEAAERIRSAVTVGEGRPKPRDLVVSVLS